MKRISLVVGVAALAAVNATAQLLSSPGRRAQDDIPKEVAEKIPEACRDYVAAEIRDRASKQATAEAEKKFNVLFDPSAWTNNCGKSVLILFMDFMTGTESSSMHDKDGRLVQVGAREDFEEWRWRDARQKGVIEELWRNQSVVDAALSNAVAKVAQEKKMPGLRRRSPPNISRSENTRVKLLEELIPLEEAMSLAKDGNGKGYFQLALRYAGGNELPRDSKLAYKMLCKARDADYANAVLVEGLCDEANLQTSQTTREYRRRASVDSAMRRYCGVAFANVRHDSDLLTNEVAYARVMGKYEKAKALGVLTATNQIAALNKRLEDLKSEKAKLDLVKSKVDENNKKVLGLLSTKLGVADSKVESFLKEYLGVQFGDGIEKFPQTVKRSSRNEDQYRILPVVKKFKYLDKAIGSFMSGRLISVAFVADIDEKYSESSVEARMEQVYDALTDMWGIEKDAFSKDWVAPHKILNSRYAFARWGRFSIFDPSAPKGSRRCGIKIKDIDLESALKKAESEKGEALPEVK